MDIFRVRGNIRGIQGTNQNLMVSTNLVHIAIGPERDLQDRRNQKIIENQHPSKFWDKNQIFQTTTRITMKPFAIPTHPDTRMSIVCENIYTNMMVGAKVRFHQTSNILIPHRVLTSLCKQITAGGSRSSILFNRENTVKSRGYARKLS